jgi:hypothetical protein|tara:strand:+ start:98 stop:706 length:609 start_codon:yes stop_codon:yes gene_type:complete
MGELSIFEFQEPIEKFKCQIYVETGTGVGVCLSHMLQYGFDRYYSIDLDEELILKAKEKFKNKNVEFYNDFSHKALAKLVPTLPTDKAVFFFLDAHFPDADFGKITYEESIKTYKEDAFPLLNEIKTIKEHRDISKDCFIIDDWSLYDTDQTYEYGDWKHKNLQDSLGLKACSSDILENFEETHNFQLSLRHQGFLSVTPKI